ncbi:uncharacterized protein RJT21DRAFT_80927 [Scheffersomyces amazonensis]|uniref:uncharacterized protein n=1 Tax=Scheffersomyces amazonensis TaxID=1078765 RepID=UPI00315CEA4F
MSYPVILVKNVVKYDYSQLVERVIANSNLGLTRIVIVIQQSIDNSNQLNSILPKYYGIGRTAAQAAGYNIELQIDVIYNRIIDRAFTNSWSVIYKSPIEDIEGEVDTSVPTININAPINPEQLHIQIHNDDDNHNHNHNHTSPGFSYQQFPVTAVGGTFDHLHDGHKILLSMALFLARTKLIIGITGAKLLVNKKYAEALEPFSVRQSNVVEFLALLNSAHTNWEIYEINDVCGPTGFVGDIDALVLSYESAKGGEYVNEYRTNHGFRALQVISIDVIGGNGDQDNNWQGKLSSTDFREWQLKHKA